MNGIKFFPKNLEITNKRIFLRVDLNVPLLKGKILDHTRINKKEIKNYFNISSRKT